MSTKPRRNKRSSFRRAAGFLLMTLTFALGVVLWAAFSWIKESFGVGLEELLYTLAAPLKGADSGVVARCVQDRLPAVYAIAGYALAAALLFCASSRRTLVLRIRFFRWNWSSGDVFPPLLRCMALLSAASLVFSLVYVDKTMQVLDYVRLRRTPTTIYEDRYADPKAVEITGTGKNLIYIYLESMETTYASEAAGGRLPEKNYIPLLTALAGENTSFSNSEKLGGFHPITGAMNTVCAIFSATTGVPYSFPVGKSFEAGANMSNYQAFASGITSLGDILEEKGYQNEFLCGSDAGFAGRREYFTQHGSYKIFDLYTAWETGYVPNGYHNGWWGFEDTYLYEIAKDELLSLSQSGRPFNFTMLTVDTHAPSGYICPLCEEVRDFGESQDLNIIAAAVSCADRQAADFIAWCREQDFYKDTVIVVTGDHPRMGANLVEVPYYERTIYNCFLNAGLPARTENREFTAMDLFPTVLAAMGFQIEGDRLGLGTNLFSDKPTLCEELGYSELGQEIGRYSSYYLKHFA